jgi:hypothetical protein
VMNFGRKLLEKDSHNVMSSRKENDGKRKKLKRWRGDLEIKKYRNAFKGIGAS